MINVKGILHYLFLFGIAMSIPGLLILNGIQAGKYRDLKKEVSALEKKQEKLIEENKKLITSISVLSSSDRIETIAENDLGMRKAETEEIVRVEMRKK
ncbi:cell division protein FtsL [Treponema sp.]|uniref:cell division protein FtsL n=1 Tax=Treponema sp. TaxID=166 RepID=UPI003F105C52